MAEAELAPEQGQQVRDGDGPAAKAHLLRDVDEPLPESLRFVVTARREQATALRDGLGLVLGVRELQVGRQHVQAANELDGLLVGRAAGLLDAVEDARLPPIAADAAHRERCIRAAARVLHFAPRWVERLMRTERDQGQPVGRAVERPLLVTPLFPGARHEVSGEAGRSHLQIALRRNRKPPRRAGRLGREQQVVDAPPQGRDLGLDLRDDAADTRCLLT